MSQEAEAEIKTPMDRLLEYQPPKFRVDLGDDVCYAQLANGTVWRWSPEFRVPQLVIDWPEGEDGWIVYEKRRSFRSQCKQLERKRDGVQSTRGNG